MTNRLIAAAAAAAVALLPLTAFGQTLDGKGRGLDALDESVVMARLSSDGLTTLLDRDMDLFKVPPAEREQQKSGIALTELANAGGLKPADRRALAERVAKALDPTVAKATDPAALLRQAIQLIHAGVEPTVAELEFFGDNPVTQAQLNPVAATVRHMLMQAGTLATAEVERQKNAVNNNNFNIVQPKLRAAGVVKRGAIFGYHQSAYAYCLSLPAGDSARAKVADEAIAYLKQYDTPTSDVQPGIRLAVGKLLLVKGDLPAAKAMLQSAYKGQPATKPLPKPAEESGARYFAAVADLYAGNFAAASSALDDLTQWQTANYLPTLEAGGQNQIKAADAMLQFRIASAQADKATGAEKQKFNDQAVTILANLLESQNDPTLRDLVFDQLAGRIPEDPDFAALNPLALSAVQQQGFDEFNKKEGEPFNEPRLRRGVAASQEIVRREGKPGVSHAQAVKAAEFAAYALDQKLHDDPAAAGAYMDFMERYPTEPEATAAMQNAGVLVFKLHRAAASGNGPDPVAAKLYDRFLPLAVNAPFNQKQIAMEYADLLRTQGKYADALRYYGEVAPTDKRYAAAQFRTLLTLYTALGDPNVKLAADQRQAMATRLQSVAESVDKAATADAAAARADADKQQALGQLAIARYDAALSAVRDLKDPAKCLQQLDGFEDKIAGLSNAKAFGQTAQVQRVTAYMDQGKTTEASDILLKVLADNPDAGEDLMFQMIKQIDHDLDVAKGGGDKSAQTQLAGNKARLSGFLVTYAQNNKNPKVQEQLPAYRLYDADSKRQAAELTDDAAARTANLTAALAQYQALKSAGNADPLIDLGIGLTQYDLGQYEAAVRSLGPVMKKVGQPFVLVNEVQTANAQYWETYYKQLRSIAEVAKAKPGDARAQADLKLAKQRVGSFYVLYGDKTGGDGYRADFAKLAADLGVPTEPKAAPAVPAKK